MFVKICGITRPPDAVAAAGAGADAIGLNFVPSSRRNIDLATAREIVAVLPDHVLTVGIFQGHGVDEILAITAALGLDAAQLHGGEPPAFTARVADGVETVIKAVTAGTPAAATVGDHRADIVMLDAPTPGAGVAFEWAVVGDLVLEHRILLAGGLRPETVAGAIAHVRPWGVDVASGVEARPAVKDPDAVARFVAAARGASHDGHAPGKPRPCAQKWRP